MQSCYTKRRFWLSKYMTICIIKFAFWINSTKFRFDIAEVRGLTKDLTSFFWAFISITGDNSNFLLDSEISPNTA